jgi:hypothetical protein
MLSLAWSSFIFKLTLIILILATVYTGEQFKQLCNSNFFDYNGSFLHRIFHWPNLFQ